MRCLGAEPPRVESLHADIARATVATLAVDTAAMRAAVERVALFATGPTPVRVRITPETVTLSCGQEGDEATETLAPAALEGDLGDDGFVFGLQATYLSAALASTGTAQTRLALAAPTKPIIATPATDDGSEDRDDRWHLVMPVRLAKR